MYNIKYRKKPLKIADKIGNRGGESKCYGNLGSVYDDLGNFEKAIEYYEKSLKIAKEIGDIDLKRVINLSLSQIYYESNPEHSYDYCRHSIELSRIISGNLVEEQHKMQPFLHTCTHLL